jgi:DNA-binding GntR family transcriptional regulator
VAANRIAVNANVGPATRQQVLLNEVIYATLLENLRAQALPPGLVIGEAAVGAAFGTSRAPALTALQRLAAEGYLVPGRKRGFLVGPPGAPPVRLDLIGAGLRLPSDFAHVISQRVMRARLYPTVEREIAACLPYGRFQINELALAQHYGTSRTIAHEFLVRLERLNITRQDGSRWLAGPLRPEDLRDLYELRWLLEPVALSQAAPLTPHSEIEAAYGRARQCRAMARRPTARQLHAVERDLHTNIVMRATNREMVATIYRSQLPLMATNDTFLPRVTLREPKQMLDEHLAVLAPLRAGDVISASKALEAHLRSAFVVLSARFERLSQVAFTPPTYMKRIAL